MNSSKCWISPSMLRYVALLSGMVSLSSRSTFTGPPGMFSADARVARVEPLPGRGLHDVVNLLPLVEGVEERGQRPEVERRGADAQEVVRNAGQFGEDGAEVLAARRDLDAEELLDGVVPGDL